MRFSNVSPFKNVQLIPAKKENWWSELPLSSGGVPDSSDGIRATDTCAIVRGSSAGSLLFLPYEKTGKYGQKAPTWHASAKAITDFDTSFTQPLIAVASDDGRINVAKLPTDVSAEQPSLQLDATISVSAPAQKAVEVVQFHPMASGLLLSSQGPSIQIWDISHGGNQAVLSAKGSEKGHWHASWSHDGRIVQTAAKDNTLNLWDIRTATGKPVAATNGHQGFNKASRATSVNDLLFTTGFTKTRDRECSLWDPRNFQKPLSSNRIDTNTGVLVPIVDHARKLVYLAGRSDITLRWAEIGNDSSLTMGGTALPSASQGAAMVPSTSSTLNVMQAEVGKLVVLASDAVYSATLQIPRRTYLDFYPELYPDIPAYQSPSQEGDKWLQGQDTSMIMVTAKPNAAWGITSAIPASSTPAKSAMTEKSAASQVSAAPSMPKEARQHVVPTSAKQAPLAAPVSSSTVPIASNNDSAPIKEMAAASLSSINPPVKTAIDIKAPQAAASVTAKPLPPVSAASATSATSAEQSGVSPATESQPNHSAPGPAITKSIPATHWSRSFLAGKTALKPDYDDVHGIAATMGATTQMLQANTKYLFYPLNGPGGRIAVHPVSAKGRMPTQAPTLTCGSDVIDFVTDPFNSGRLYIAASDAKIHVMRCPKTPQGDHGEAEIVLADSMDKIAEIRPNPVVADVLASVSDDHGEGVLRIWNTRDGVVLHKQTVPGNGIFSLAWDAIGSKVAVTCKDRKLRVLDPRQTGSKDLRAGASHDSARPCKVLWLSPIHLLTCGFSRSAYREILLHRVSDNGTEIVGRTNIDISPAPLFPHYDADTKILFVYSKGERTCHAYEVQAEATDKTKMFTKLPSFEHGTLQTALTFLPKQAVDVKKVEIAKAFRLTPSSIQLISFTIPRAKMDFFQDDIFPPTIDQMQAVLSMDDWQSGADATLRYIDLRPGSMPLLSEAPPPAPRIKQQVAAKKLTEEQQQQQYLDDLFKSKQAEVDSDEDDLRVKKRDNIDEDDW